MEYLILMTIAGSALCLAYLGWEKLLHKSLTQCMRYRALTLTLLVYVVPWVWLKDIYGYVVTWLLPVRVPEVIGHPVAMADIVTEEEAYTTLDYRWRLLIIGIWLLVALILLIRKSGDYIKDRNRLCSQAVIFDDRDVQETVKRLRKELNYRGRLIVYRTPIKSHTFTLGAIKPIIFLQEEYEDDQLYYILKHEMTHVVRRDLLIKLIWEFACCLHWFNYLVFGLNGLFNDVCEESCDERVLRGCPQEVCRAYMKLLVDNMNRHRRAGEQMLKIPYQSCFDNDYENVTERVNLIMEAKEIKSWKKRLAGSVFALMLVVNSFTAMAYPDVYHVHDGNEDLAELVVDGDAFWTNDEFGNEYDMSMDKEVFYDNEFIDEEGNVYPVDTVSPQVFCIKHNIVSGRFQAHKRYDDGGCKLMIYESTKCTICNTIWIGELISEGTWKKCPHP